MKKINLPKNKRARLCRTFGTSGVTVWSALNYVTNSPLAEKIRRAAIAEGGVIENQITAMILHNEKPVKNYEQVVIRDWGNIVFEAQSLSDSLNR